MDWLDIERRFGELSTANLADACMRADVLVRGSRESMRPVVASSKLAGRALPARHAGSVDVFLEAFNRASAGDVLVVDNAGRTDEACVGDLVVIEAQAGSREAFGALVQQFESTVFATVMSRLRHRAEAREVTQDVFVQAMRKLRIRCRGRCTISCMNTPAR